MIRVTTSALLLLSLSALAGVPPEQQAEVEHLIATLANSECVMIRNGKSHDGEKAADHVRRKYEHFRDEIDSTEDFIAYSATRSLISGRAYQVQCPGEDPQSSAEWLLAELEAYRATTP
jgi:hypothetical protein